MPLILPNTIVNGENADAVPVEQNYSIIESYVNNETIQRDGSVAMQAPLLLTAGAPTADLHAANKEYVDGFLPVGIMMPWPSPSAPAGGHWMLCNGAALAVAAYTELYGVLGTRYGAGTGTFLLPNLTGRTMFGFDSAQTAFNAIGKAGGTFNVPVPPHAHPMPHTHTIAHTHEHPHTHSTNPASVTSGAGGAHQHNGDIASHGTVGSNASVLKLPGAGVSAGNVVDMSATHTHTVDIPATTSAQPNEATTGASSAASTGAVSAANTANNTDALTSSTIDSTMIQPYVVVNFIIRVL
jgi:microcystin-dependent protein